VLPVDSSSARAPLALALALPVGVGVSADVDRARCVAAVELWPGVVGLTTRPLGARTPAFDAVPAARWAPRLAGASRWNAACAEPRLEVRLKLASPPPAEAGSCDDAAAAATVGSIRPGSTAGRGGTTTGGGRRAMGGLVGNAAEPLAELAGEGCWDGVVGGNAAARAGEAATPVEMASTVGASAPGQSSVGGNGTAHELAAGECEAGGVVEPLAEYGVAALV